MQHITIRNCAKNKLKCNFISATLGPNNSDIHIEAHPDEDTLENRTAEPIHTVEFVVVKEERLDEDLDGINEDDDQVDNVNNEFIVPDKKYSTCDGLRKALPREPLASSTIQAHKTQSLLKHEIETFECTLCYAEFTQENEYNQHMGIHIQEGGMDGECETSHADKLLTTSPGGDSTYLTEHKRVRMLDEDCQSSDDSTRTTVASRSRALKKPANNEAKETGKIRKNGRRVLEIKDDELNNQTTDETNTKKRSNPSSKLCDGLKELKRSRNGTSLDGSRKNDATSKGSQCRMRTYKSYPCDVCDYKCASYSQLVVHMRTHTGEKPYSCALCEYRCAQNSNLQRHMLTHTGETPYSCTICEYRCARKSYLVVHMRTHTGEKPYHCKLCTYKCSRNSDLVSHTRTHTGEKPFSCKYCDFKCSHSKSLLLHTRTHTGEKPYSCKVCEYKCARNSDLVSHVRTHTGETPYSCQLCEFRCAHTKSLVLHMRTHTGEKPYSCKLCDYKCAQGSNLLLHMRSHTGEKPYSCKLCEYKCVHNSTLVKHMKTHTI